MGDAWRLDGFDEAEAYVLGERMEEGPAASEQDRHLMKDHMPEGSARAYLRDLPAAELHVLDAGHWALETSLGEIVPLIRDFLGRVHA